MRSWPLVLTLLGTLLHALVLLVPSGLLFLVQSWNWELLSFVSLILTAGVTESFSISNEDEFGQKSVVDPLAIRVAMVTGICILLLLWLAQVEYAFPIAFLSPQPPWLSVCGAMLLIGGIGLRAIAIRTLGKHFVSDICCPGPPVNHGIYRWVAHPSEIGLLMIVVGGCGLLSAVATTMLAVGVLVPISLWRTRRENWVLRASSQIGRIH